MNISAPFIRRPVATTLLAVAHAVLQASQAYTQLPVAPLPRVDFPTISVSGALPGASPETMASAVATPLERRFGRIAGVTEITSGSTLGSTNVTLQFDLERDVEAAARDVQAAINAAGGDLPANLPTRPNYRKVNPADAPILILSLTSKTLAARRRSTMRPIRVLAQKISQVSGVGQVIVGGGQQPAVRVQVDPQALAGLDLGLEDIRTVLSEANVNQAKGAISGARRQYTHAASTTSWPGRDEYKSLVVAYRDGAAVRLGDDRPRGGRRREQPSRRLGRRHARRADDHPAPARREHHRGDRPHQGALAAAQRVGLARHRDEGRHRPRADHPRLGAWTCELTLVLSVVLVVLVVFSFLRSWRATVIPSVAVPLSLVGTFGVMYLLDYSLDNLSLMALTISTGFVVDDAIVVTENIARLIEAGESPLAAALKGAQADRLHHSVDHRARCSPCSSPSC